MTAPLIPIEAHEQNIGQIFSDTYAFEIPPYQRPYAWEKDQARELLTDLLEAMDNKDASGGVYFLGSIVLIKSSSDPSSRVIDGQQRLTTLTILLSILRDLTADQEVGIERRVYVFQKASADRGTQDRYRLLLRQRDRPFFSKHVQSPGATNSLPDPNTLEESLQRIAENTQYLRSQLETLAEGRRNALVAFIVQRCYLVVVAVPTADTARRIFTVLNARGLDLTPTDILKANLLDRAGAARESDLANRWESVEQALGRERMVELFGHIRMIYERDKPRLALEVGFPKSVQPFNGDADHFVGDILEPIADALLMLADSGLVQKQFGAEAARATRSLSRIDNKDWMPAALLCFWRRPKGDVSGVAKFLVCLERLAYYLFVTRAGVNDRIERFAAVMNEFDPRPDKEAHSIGVELSAAEQNEFLDALSGPLYLQSRVCKPVLQRLDEALSTGGANYDELVSIEHVLPQTVEEGSEWVMLFPDERQRGEWTHRLANLVFLTHRTNTRASNWEFERKKKEYFSSRDGSSPFLITQGVLRTDKWTVEHLIERQRILLKKLADVWQLERSEAGFRETTDDQLAKGAWEFTDYKLIEAKRKTIMNTLSQREGIDLVNTTGALCYSADRSLRAVCTISKLYEKNSSQWYWYGYSPQWNEFLSEGKESFLILGCIDQDTAYAIPYSQIKKILTRLHRTQEKHWHIVVEKNRAGQLDLVIPKTGKIPLGGFELKADK